MSSTTDLPLPVALSDVSNLFSTLPVTSWCSSLQPGHAGLKGSFGAAQSFIVREVFLHRATALLYVLPDREAAAYAYTDLVDLLGAEQVMLFPAVSRQPYEEDNQSPAQIQLRAEVLSRVMHLEKLFIVSYPEAIAEQVVNQKALAKHSIEVKVGEKLSIEFLLEVLVEYHFERVDFVYEPGQFAIRGGIIDVFSFAYDSPYRIELLGEEVETIRTFNPETQLSIQKFDYFTLVPNLNAHFQFEARESLTAFLPNDCFIWVQDNDQVAEAIDIWYQKAEQEWAKISEKQALGQVILQSTPTKKYLISEQWLQQLQQKQVLLSGRNSMLPTLNYWELQFQPQPALRKNFELLIAKIADLTAEGYTCCLVSKQENQQQRLLRIFEDLKAKHFLLPLYANLHEGFISPELKLACFTDHQLFERYHKYKVRDYKERSISLTLKDMKSLKKGDYVVHIDHGVGIFDGLETLHMQQRQQEAVRILYKDKDILYVSINSLHKISKYSSAEGGVPKINKLGTDAWEKLKNRTKSKVKDIAKDLIALYAKRRATEGFAFSPDSYLQYELEASFMYEDTPDQNKTNAAIKEDMERAYPMDRLVCGDVGFGKTELAVRAAFKAVTDSKQVAILVPTTILALQHYKTFSTRLKDFPCNVKVINRFVPASEQKKTLAELAEGKVDILIGTHAIISKKVVFKDLGLLIVDEEQKFGVAVKEKLKSFRVNVDTLTLTATPIPRTMQFSLMGARDLSVITTPPPNRQPVTTTLIGMDEERIKTAILFEVERGGQVFFVHNRVQNIQEIAQYIEKICPNVTAAVAHGQMPGEALEEVMMGFIEGAFDVLVSTNIIESGLDIPNANTIIINQAQHFGLSDLHQMRGRVGRSNRKAFCYLITPPLASLTNEASKRLSALEQFSDLGSGFSIALRDLDIRGAGNLLGAEQSGFISEIGFDLFQKILDEAIRELKETEYADVYEQESQSEGAFDCQIDTDLEALIPLKYVSNTSERLALYVALDNIQTPEGLQRWVEDLTDRFGPVPQAVITLTEVVKLRWLAQKAGVEKLVFKQQYLRLQLVPERYKRFYNGPVFERMLQYITHFPTQCKLVQKQQSVQVQIQSINDFNAIIALLSNWVNGQSS